MTDINEAHGLEVVAWMVSEDGSAEQEPLCRLSDATAVIDQLTVERDAARESMYALDELTDKQSDLINTQIKRVAELTESLDSYRAMLLDSDAELAATKEHLHTVEPEFHSLQATRNMAEKTVEIMIRRAESAEAELATLKSATVVMPEPVGYTTWGMIECIKALPFTGRIGVRAEKTARWNIPLYTDPVYAKQVIDHGCSYGK